MKNKRLLRLGAAAFVLLLTLIVTLPRNSNAQATGNIEAGDQKIIDGTITVARASINQDGWIVVRQADEDGKIQIVPDIGKVRLRAGESEDIEIELNAAVAEDASLWVMLHIDAGDVGVYEFPSGPDTPIVTGGIPIMTQFTVTGSEITPVVPPSPPDNLPVTAGEELPFALLGVAIALLVAGRLLLGRGEETVVAPQAV